VSQKPETFFTATPAQAKFADAVFSGAYRYLAYGGGIRSGKTATSLMLVQSLCKVFPKSRWAIVRKDLPTLRRNVLPSFTKFRVPGFTGEVNQSSWTAECTNGSQIIFFTESLSEDPELNRWRGLEVNGFFLEEANELQEVSFRKAIERAGSWVVPNGGNQPPPLVVATFNPSAGWVKRTFYDPYMAGTLESPFYYQPATIVDNPHLPQDYVESLKSLPERDYKRFVEGDWSFISGAFFDELQWATHRTDRLDDPTATTVHRRWAALPEWWRYWCSYDWGYRHPAVFQAFAMNGGGQVFLLDTVRMHRLDDEEQARTVAETMPPLALQQGAFAGHDVFAKRMAHTPGHETVADVFWRYKIRLAKANIARVQGAAAMRRMLTRKQKDGTLGTPRLLVCDTPGNRWAFEQWMEMVPDPLNPDDVQKVDANEDGEGGDDAADTTRYGLASPTWLPIEPHGERPIVKQGDPPKQPDWIDTNTIDGDDDPRGAEVPGGMSSRLGQGW